MKRLFIVGASVLQLPAIKKAKEMGLYVGVADRSPEAVGVDYADEYFNVSTIDEQGILEAARNFMTDGIVTLATDMPVRSVAFVCEKLGLTGLSYETAVKSTDKGEMIEAFEASGVAHPWYHIVQTPDNIEGIASSLSFPCITKPTDSSGSRGVMLVSDPSQLRKAVSYSSERGRSGAVIVEEYMLGPEISVEVFVLQGVSNVIQVTDKLTTGPPHFVEMGHSQPSQLPVDALQAVQELAKRAVLSVGIHDGPAHVEIIVTEQGPKVVELGARLGGDCIATHLVPLSTGVDLVKATIQVALGQTPDIEPSLSQGAAIRYIVAPEGQIRSIVGVANAREVEDVQEITLTKRVGDVVEDLRSSVDRVGFVIAQGFNSGEATARCEEAATRIRIDSQEEAIRLDEYGRT